MNVASSDPQTATARSGSDYYRALFEVSPVPMWVYDDASQLFLDVNRAAVEQYGYSREEFLRMTVAEIRPQEDRPRFHAALERIRHGIPNEVKTWRHTHKDGSIRDVEVSAADVLFDGRAARLVMALDVTERRQMELAVEEREEKLRFVVGQMPAVLWTTDATLSITSCLGGVLETLNVDPADVVGRNMREFLTLDSESIAARGMLQALGGSAVRYDDWWMNRFFQTHIEPIFDSNGQITGTLGFAVDITDRRRVEETLQKSEQRYRLLFERNLAGVYRSTVDGKLLECNEAFAKILGYSSPEEIMEVPTWQFYFSSEDREKTLSRVAEHGHLVNFELCLRRKDGEPVWVIENETLIEDDAGVTPMMEGTLIDITDRKRAEERIQHQAYHDALTDLPNRTLFNDRLKLAMSHARRTGSKLVVMFVDLDHFKLINDTLGHSAGDELIRRVADRIQKTVRFDDTVARVGGDEFMLLLHDLHGEDDAARLAQKIRNALSEPFVIADSELYVTASIGIGVFPTDGDDVETLVKCADMAVFRAKELGRDTYQFFTPVAQKRAQERLALENSLRRALDRRELQLHYQPQVSLLTGRVVGAEALIRWNHTERGLVLPGEFIHVAEEIGLILPIGEWVLRSACEEAKQWTNGSSHLRVAVNLSARQFQQPGLAAMVRRVLEETGLDGKRLDLEITESLAMYNLDHTIALLTEFRDTGIRVSMDDFGTGYSSLSYLKQMPIDCLKIDRAFISEISREHRDRSIVRGVIDMAHNLGLTVLAEGVETEQQLETLRELQCDEMQGFLFSRPVPPESLDALFAAGRDN